MGSLALVQTLAELGYPHASALNPADLDWLWEQPSLKPFLDWFCTTLDSRNVLTDQELKEFQELEASLKDIDQSHVDHLSQLYGALEEDLPLPLLESEIESLEQELQCLESYEEDLHIQEELLNNHLATLAQQASSLERATKATQKEIKAEQQKTSLLSNKMDKSCEDLCNQLDALKARRNDLPSLAGTDLDPLLHLERKLFSDLRIATSNRPEANTDPIIKEEIARIHIGIRNAERNVLKSRMDHEGFVTQIHFYDVILGKEDLLEVMPSNMKREVKETCGGIQRTALQIQEAWSKAGQTRADLVQTQLLLTQAGTHCHRQLSAALDHAIMILGECLSQASRLQILFLAIQFDRNHLNTLHNLQKNIECTLREEQDQFLQRQKWISEQREENPNNLVIRKEDKLANFLLHFLGSEDISGSLFSTYGELQAVVEQLHQSLLAHRTALSAEQASEASLIQLMESRWRELEELIHKAADKHHDVGSTLSALNSNFHTLEEKIIALKKDFDIKRKILKEDDLLNQERTLYAQFYTSPERFQAIVSQLVTQAERETHLKMALQGRI